MSPSIIIFYCLLVISREDAPVTQKMEAIPKILSAAFLQREAFDTARFTCRYEREEPGRALVRENWKFQFAKNGLHATEYGDDDGVMLSDPNTGKPRLGYAGATQPAERILDFERGSSWLHRSGSRHFVEGPAGIWTGYVDFRALGLRSIEVQYRSPKKQLELIGSLIDWKSKDIGSGVVLVTARGRDHDSGSHYEYEWEIAANRGPAVISSRQHLLDKNKHIEYESEARNTLVQVDGVWWPRRVEIKSNHGTRVVIEFANVEFNRDTHPKRISPELLNMPIGAEIVRAGQDGRYFHTGGGLMIDEATWLAEKNAYDLTPLKAFYANVQSKGLGKYPDWWESRDSDCGIQGVADNPDLWESYVRRWAMVRSYEGDAKGSGPVTDEQRTAAQGVLDDCRKQATPIRSRIDKEAARLAAELADVNNQLAKADDKSRAELTKRAGELMVQSGKFKQAPEIERIFESLKKRLDGLLTKEQLAPYVPAKPVPPPPGPRPAGKRPGAAVP